MSLMLGTGPFGREAAGRFAGLDRPDGAVLYWERWPKRFRVRFNGRTVADSRRAMALHESGHLMRLYVPTDDLLSDALVPSERRTRCPHKGEARYWSLAVDDRRAEDALWAYPDPIPSAAFLQGHASFDLDRVDDWFMEDDRGYAHPRDPYHRVDVQLSSRRVVVSAGGERIAATDSSAILFETGLPPRYYLPPGAVPPGLLTRSETVSDCPYKGRGQHWHLHTPAGRIEDAAWSLPDPLGESVRIRHYLSFYPDKVAVEVDGGRLPG